MLWFFFQQQEQLFDYVAE